MEEEKKNLDYDLYRAQKRRFYNETKKKGKKYVESLILLIENETMRVSGLSQDDLKKALHDAVGDWEIKNADRSAKLNRKLRGG